MRIALVLLVLLRSSWASADRRFDAHLGAGVEGGLIQRKARPDGIAEVGLAFEWLSTERRVGVGLSFETHARPGVDLTTYEEDKLDLMFRFARGPHRGGVGAGLRFLTPESIDGVQQRTFLGIDWLRVQAATSFGRANGGRVGVLGIDGYVAWTIGCYLARDAEMTEGPPPPMHDVSCASTITNTYVAGVAFSLSDR